MPNYTLELELFGLYAADMPVLELWSEGSLFNSYSINANGTSIIETLSFGGTLPSSLEFRFSDASAETPRHIEIRSLKINNKTINAGNYLSQETLTQGETATVDVVSTDYIFDASEPSPALFSPVSKALTNGNDQFRDTNGTTDLILDGMDGNDFMILGDGNDTVTGGAGRDTIRGQGGNDLIYGAEDDDRLYGGDGNDTMYGGSGDDRLHGDAGDDELHGNDGNDALVGHDGNDIITGGLGNDKINAGDGDDIIYGDEDDDVISAGAGNDTADGGTGNDLLFGGAGDDRLDGGDGADTLVGNDGNDILNGGGDNDLILAQQGNDTVYGGDGDDEIYGGEGNDYIDGGAGADTLYGDDGDIYTIMEAGRTAVTQTSSTQWHTVNFTQAIESAVVKMFAEDMNGEPFTLRVRNITNNGFQFQLDEFDNQDGVTALENLSWVAVASGTHVLTGGATIQAGYTTATNSANTNITFNTSFSGTPVVMTQLSSDNELSAVVTRNSNVSNSGFTMRMNEEEANNGNHATEDIGWIAIDSGVSVLGNYITGTTGNVVTHNNYSMNFANGFTGNPIILADMQDIGGADPSVAAGVGGLTNSSLNVRVAEETSADTETNHASENVGFFALQSGVYIGSDNINGSDTVRGGAGDDILYADAVVDGIVSAANNINTLAIEILGQSPENYWALNETSGTTVTNQGSVGAATNGTVVGGATVGGPALYAGGNGSVDFDGINDGITIPNDNSINTGTYSQKTVELVFNADNVTTRQVLFEEGGNTHGFTIYLAGGNLYISGEHDGVFANSNFNAAVSAGTTYHVAFTFDSGANAFTGYLNGANIGSIAVGGADFPSHSGAIGIAHSPDGGVQFHDGEGGGQYFYNGRISDVAVYTTALSQTEIQEHANAILGVRPAPGPIDDILYGGDGFDQFFAGDGRDVFVFEADSAFNDVDQINGFDFGEEDSIDISDLLIGYVDGVSDINDFVSATTIGSNTVVAVDRDGSAGGYGFTDVVQINNVSGNNADILYMTNALVVT
jgi:Ca2+-binding RTX toxin-like protein